MTNIFHKLFGGGKSETAPKKEIKQIVLANESHRIEENGYYYDVDKSFRAAKSHAGEADLLSTYAHGREYGAEGDLPYIARQVDDDVYCPIDEFLECARKYADKVASLNKNDEFLESGTVADAAEITPLEGKWLFKAKKACSYGMMYFYAFSSKDKELGHSALCMVYPAEYVGTENEAKLMSVLDAAAESFGTVAESKPSSASVIFDIKNEADRPTAENIAAQFVAFLRQFNALEETYADKSMSASNSRTAYEKQQGRQTEAMRTVVEEFRSKKEALVTPRINGVHWRWNLQKPAKFASIDNGGTLTFTMKSKAKITADLLTGSDYGIDCYRFAIRPKEDGGWEITSFSYRMFSDGTFRKLNL